MRRRRDMMERERPRLEIVPMIDIMMFLLVFFVMIVLKMIPDSGITLSLPGASTAQDLPHTDVDVIIDPQGNLHVNDSIVTLDSLQSYLTTEKATHNTDVIVIGDKTTPLQKMMDVMDTARKAGITDVGIAAKGDNN